MGRELELERTYKYLRCYEFNIGDVDLIRIAAENPMSSDKAALELVHYFEDKFLLGNILMCRRDFGYRCMNVFEHMEKNLKDAERRNHPFKANALNDLTRLLYNNLDENHLTHDRGFCRTYFPEQPEQCHN